MTPPPPDTENFLTTRWTRVCLAKEASDDGRRALADLCATYYEPVVAFLRCELRDEAAAREMSHAFFERVLDGGCFQSADPARGRFRSYLLGAVKHFAANARQAAARQKRGGGLEPVPLEDAAAVPDAGLSPDKAFERQWALTVLKNAMAALEKECAAAGQADFFAVVKPLLGGDVLHGGQLAAAEAAGIRPPTLRMAVHRLRRRLRDFLKAEIAGTLEDPSLVQEEMRALLAAMAG